MKLVLLLSLALSALVVLTNGMPPIGRDYNSHCRCFQLESRVIPQDSLKSIKIIHKGSQCKVLEVIANLKSGERICLNTQSPWVQKLIRFINKRQGTNSFL